MDDNKLVIFGFSKTNSQNLLLSLSIGRQFLLKSQKEDIEGFVEDLVKIKPEFILGLGEYSGRDQDKIRQEVRCSNKFKNETLGKSLEKIDIEPISIDSDLVKLSKNMGNSYCNLVSYLIMKKIKSGQLKSRYIFLHLPKDMEQEIMASEINGFLIPLQRKMIGV